MTPAVPRKRSPSRAASEDLRSPQQIAISNGVKLAWRRRRREAQLPTISEHALQKQVVDHLARVLQPPVWWSAIDHAGKLGPRQAAARKARGVKRGIADILIMWRDWYTRPHSIWIELKRPGGGSLSQEQKDFDFAMIRCGSLVFVCRSIEEVEAAMDLAKVPRLRMAG